MTLTQLQRKADVVRQMVRDEAPRVTPERLCTLAQELAKVTQAIRELYLTVGVDYDNDVHSVSEWREIDAKLG